MSIVMKLSHYCGALLLLLFKIQIVPVALGKSETQSIISVECSLRNESEYKDFVISESCATGTCKSNSTYAPKIICYVTNWASIRPGKSVYHASDIDASLCTHLVYSFATLDQITSTIVPSIPDVDINQKLYQQVTNLKTLSKRPLKVSLALGGWAESANSRKYSEMIHSEYKRTNFIHSVVTFLRKHNFDGLDLDWEYPKCWQGNCTTGPASDKKNFVTLIHYLRVAFNDYKFLLSVAVSANRSLSAEGIFYCNSVHNYLICKVDSIAYFVIRI